MGAAGQHAGDPQRHAAGSGQSLHVAGGAVRLAGVPLVYFLPFPAGFLVRAPVRGDEGAVQDEVGKSLLNGPVQGLAQRRRRRGEHLDGLVLVPVCGGLRDPEARAQPADVRPVPEPRQREDRLLPAGQGTGPIPGADLAAVLGQQARHEHRQLEGDVKGDTIGQHAEPPAGRTCGETSCTGGSALSRGSPAYVRVSARMTVTPGTPGSPSLRKPHYVGWCQRQPPVNRVREHAAMSAYFLVEVRPGTTNDEFRIKYERGFARNAARACGTTELPGRRHMTVDASGVDALDPKAEIATEGCAGTRVAGLLLLCVLALVNLASRFRDLGLDGLRLRRLAV